MESLRERGGASPEVMGGDSAQDPGVKIRGRLGKSDVTAEYFVPAELAVYDKGVFGLPRDEREAAKTRIAGVRLLPCDPKGEDLSFERATQHDIVGLTRGVRTLRTESGLEGCVLSRAILRCKEPTRQGGSRVRFALACPESTGAYDDKKAARSCHRQIRRAVFRSGLVVIEPKTFDADRGFAGLEDWGSQVRLRRRRLWPALLLLLPLLLLFFKDCSGPESFFGMAIETRSMIIIVDKSSSMQSHFGAVQAEGKAVLKRMLEASGDRYANVISFDAQAASALLGLTKLDDATADRLVSFLNGLSAGGGTQLETAIKMAALEVKKHDRPTTLLILTDGEDGSIQPMIDRMPELKNSFGGVKVVAHTITPRLFPGGDSKPGNDAERRLATFAEGLDGQFGPKKEKP